MPRDTSKIEQLGMEFFKKYRKYGAFRQWLGLQPNVGKGQHKKSFLFCFVLFRLQQGRLFAFCSMNNSFFFFEFFRLQ
jgi:hypothetical protein